MAQIPVFRAKQNRIDQDLREPTDETNNAGNRQCACDGVLQHVLCHRRQRSTKAKQYGFCMDLGNGKKLTCCGDEPYEDCEETYARNSEWLLHEAFCLYAERDVFDPYEKHHSTVKDACQLAEKLQVRNLLLYHTEDKNLADRKRLYLEEGAQYYHGNLFIPDDLESFVL